MTGEAGIGQADDGGAAPTDQRDGGSMATPPPWSSGCTGSELDHVVPLRSGQPDHGVSVGGGWSSPRDGDGDLPLWPPLMSVAAFDFFFIPPYYSFAVSDVQYLLTFAVMLVVALLISRLASHKSQQAEAAVIREQRTAALYAMSRELITQRGVDKLASVASRHIHDVFHCQVAVFLPDRDGRFISIGVMRCTSTWIPRKPAFPSGCSTIRSLPARVPTRCRVSDSLYLPLLGSEGRSASWPCDPRGAQRICSIRSSCISWRPSRIRWRWRSSELDRRRKPGGSRTDRNGTHAQRRAEFGLP